MSDCQPFIGASIGIVMALSIFIVSYINRYARRKLSHKIIPGYLRVGIGDGNPINDQWISETDTLRVRPDYNIYQEYTVNVIWD